MYSDQKTLNATADFSGVMSGTALMMVDAVSGAISGTAVLIDDVTALLNRWQSRIDQRRQLAVLDAHLLNDIGIDRARALAESGKPFWQR